MTAIATPFYRTASPVALHRGFRLSLAPVRHARQEWMHSLRGGRDHRDDAGADRVGQLGPSGHDDGQVRVFG